MEEESSTIEEPQRVLTAVRVRPISQIETKSASRQIVTIPDPKRPEEGSILVCDPLFFNSERTTQERKFFERKFNFDFSFQGSESPNQELIFKKLGEPIIMNTLNGVNCSILAYGQTGSGKTFTMIGEDTSSDLAGIIPRLCRGLLAEINRRLSEPPSTSTGSYKLHSARVLCSFYEIYNEKVYDLLQGDASPTSETAQSSRVREHPEDGAYVENLYYQKISTYEEAAALMSAGLRQRVVAETKMNAASSRSHAVFSIVIKQSLTAYNESAAVDRSSKIVLVDLAGSERASLTGATGERLQEANNINKSLSTLGDVIKALSEGNGRRDAFVPYRNSVLTFLLKDSLGGNSRTTMLATVSPSDSSFSETCSTLRYIERAKFIHSAPLVNESSTDPAYVAQLQKKIVGLQEQLMTANHARKIRDTELRAEFAKRETEIKTEYQKKIRELQEQLQYQQSRALSARSPPSSPLTSDSITLSEVSTVPSTDGLEAAPIEMDKLLFAGCDDSNPQALVLSIEVKRLNAALVEKQSLLNVYEKKLSTSSIKVSGVVDTEKERLKKVALSYKHEGNVILLQYNTLLAQVKTLAEAQDSERAHHERVAILVKEAQEEAASRKSQARQLENDLQTKNEEIETARIEIEFLKAKHSSALGKHKQELLLLQTHVSRAKEAEELMRKEKEADMDKYTELMMDAQRRNEIDRNAFEKECQSLQEKYQQVQIATEGLQRERERFRNALNAKMDEVNSLEEEVAALKSTIEKEAGNKAEEEGRLRREITELSDSLQETSFSLENVQSRLVTLEMENSGLSNDIQEERNARNASELKMQLLVEDFNSKEAKRRGLEAEETLLKSGLEQEAQELKLALSTVMSTRTALDEKDKVHQDLNIKMLEMNIALQAETTAKQDAEKRASDLHVELTKRKKKLTAALQALDENKARLATLTQLEERLRIAEVKCENGAKATIESDTRHAKKDQKLIDMQANFAKQQTKISELTAALKEAESQAKAAAKTAAEQYDRQKADVKNIKIEHSVLLDEVIDLRVQLDNTLSQVRLSDTRMEEIQAAHKRQLEDLETSRSDQYQTLKTALESAEARVKLEEERVDEMKKVYNDAFGRVKSETEQRRIDATNDVQLRLDKLLLGSDEYDAQYVAIQRVLSMIDMNMAQLDADVKSAATSTIPLSITPSPFDADVMAASMGELSPNVAKPLEDILGRQMKLFGTVKGLSEVIRSISSSPSQATSPSEPTSSSLSAPDSPSTPTSKEMTNQDSPRPTHLIEHDDTSMAQEVIRAKLALAVACSENEDLQVAYRRVERVACDLKLKVATLMGDIEDKNDIIRDMMDKMTSMQRQQGNAPLSAKKDDWMMNLSGRGKK